MGSSSRIQCKWCRKNCSPNELRLEHGKWALACVHRGSALRMRQRDLRYVGAYRVLLDRAGLVQMMPTRAWYYVKRAESRKWDRVDAVSFEQVTPAWAYKLAAALTRDKDLGRKLGYVQRRELVKRIKIPGRRATNVYNDVNRGKVIPIDLRVKILRVAAGNQMARELFADDYESAVLIIRDSL